ncbi:MAG: polyphosphate polymerase domain-containing protein [Nitrososphaerales archaeon]
MTPALSRQRYELKYLVHHRQAMQISALLADYMVPDHHGDGEGQYQVTSLYYDTVDHKAYWDKTNGYRNRRKLRVRIYGSQAVTPGTPCFVEIKQRLDRVVQKRRVILPHCATTDLDHLEEIWRVSPEPDAAVLQEVDYLCKALQLQPACVVGYQRLAFEGREYDPGLRVTFDSNLKYRLHELSLSSNGQATDHYFLSPDWCIMEVKLNHRVPIWLTEVIGKHECVVRRFSKYCAAIEHGKRQLDQQRIAEQY